MIENLDNQQQNVVVALDIGTTKVCAIAGRKNEHGKLEILGVGKVESHGVSRGVVSNIEKTGQEALNLISVEELKKKVENNKNH